MICRTGDRVQLTEYSYLWIVFSSGESLGSARIIIFIFLGTRITRIARMLLEFRGERWLRLVMRNQRFVQRDLRSVKRSILLVKRRLRLVKR